MERVIGTNEILAAKQAGKLEGKYVLAFSSPEEATAVTAEIQKLYAMDPDLARKLLELMDEVSRAVLDQVEAHAATKH